VSSINSCYFPLGKVYFSTLNYHDSPIFNPELQNRTSYTLNSSKPCRLPPRTETTRFWSTSSGFVHVTHPTWHLSSFFLSQTGGPCTCRVTRSQAPAAAAYACRRLAAAASSPALLLAHGAPRRASRGPGTAVSFPLPCAASLPSSGSGPLLPILLCARARGGNPPLLPRRRARTAECGGEERG